MTEEDLTFDDVVIRFTRQIYYTDQHVFQAEVRRTPVPLPGGAFRFDVEDALEEFRRAFGARVAVSQFFYPQSDPTAEPAVEIEQGARDLANLGDEMYHLLPESFREGFPRLLQHAFEKKRGLRLIFEARAGDQADRLLNLPWEVLFAQETQAYLARSPRVLIVRRLLDAVRRSPTRMTPPFNVMHVIAHSPSASGYEIDEALLQMERETVSRSVAPGHYSRVDHPGSVEQMQAALQQGSYHIVHFLGHGETVNVGGVYAPRGYASRGYLRFVSAEGNSQWLTGEQLQHHLNAAPAVQLIVLNACRGGSTAVGNVALELTHSGLPYVVAMQEAISQDAARHFISTFYTELQRGRRIEYAVAAGRSAIATHMPGALDWCLPALYTNVGVPEQSAALKTSDRLWQWIGQPATPRQLSAGTLAYGALHVLVGLLLLMSGAAPPLPDARLLTWFAGGLMMVPPVLSLVAYLWGPLEVPPDWSFSTRAALVLRLLGAASIGLGMTTLYCVWFSVILLASLGFWGLLSLPARFGLLALASGVSIALGFSQAVGHVRAFISDARVQRPAFEWSEVVVTVAGYVLLLAPLAVLRFVPDLIAPPWGNVWVGSVLVAVGYAVRKQAVESASDADGRHTS